MFAVSFARSPFDLSGYRCDSDHIDACIAAKQCELFGLFCIRLFVRSFIICTVSQLFVCIGRTDSARTLFLLLLLFYLFLLHHHLTLSLSSSSTITSHTLRVLFENIIPIDLQFVIWILDFIAEVMMNGLKKCAFVCVCVSVISRSLLYSHL